MASFPILPPKPCYLSSLEISHRIVANPYNYKKLPSLTPARGAAGHLLFGRQRRDPAELRKLVQRTGGSSSGGVPAPAAAASGGFSLFHLPPWTNILFGSFFFSAIPIYKRLKMAQETLEKTLEGVTKAVEKAAEKADKMAEELAASLPDGQLKDVALKIEKIAEKVDKEAEAAHELILKVDEFTDKLEEIIEEEILAKVDSKGNSKSKS